MWYIRLLTATIMVMTIWSNTGCMKCGEKSSERIAEKMVEQATGGKAKMDVGTVDISGLPVNLRYPNAVASIKLDVTGPDKKETGTIWSFETKDPATQVAQFYKNALASWKQSMIAETQETTTMVFVSPNEQETVSIIITADKEKTTLNIAYTTKKK